MASPDLNATSSLTGDEKAGDLSASSSEDSGSDEDYTHDSAQSSDADDFCATNDNQKHPHAEGHRAATESSSSKDASFTAASSSDESDFDRERIPKKKVPQPKNSSYTTKNYCYVCGKAQSKIARHLLKHKEEESDIAEVCALPKRSKERKMLLDRLRNRGNYQHNQVVLQYHNGPLKLRRKPTQTNGSPNAKKFVHCVYCKGMYVRKDLWRHMRRCKLKTHLTGTTSRNKVLALTAIAEATHSQQISSSVWKILGNMKQDEIVFVLQNDFLILQLAQSLHKKYEEDPTKVHHIRQKLREMGRLLLTLRKKSTVFSFEDAIKPDNFHVLVEAVKELAGFDEERNSYKTPTLALKLVNSIKRIGYINLCRALTADNDKVLIDEAQTFVRLCTKELTKLVGSKPSSRLKESKLKDPSTIPFTRDVQLLYQYLEMKSAKAVDSLTKYESPQVYAALAKVTLTQVILFNRRSAGSISKLSLKSFEKRDQTELHEDITACPSQFGQNVSKVFITAKVLGKGGRTVAVLLTPEVVSALTLLVHKRDTCGVHRDNPHLFARPKPLCTSFFSGQHSIRTFSDECGAEKPEYLRSGHLRKHIATLFQILSLKNNELDQLAAFLGHDIRADRDFYRLPEATAEIAKISMLLLAKEKGSLARFQGKSLEEIEIEDELEPDDEENDVENRVQEHSEGSGPLLQQQDPSSPEGSSSVAEALSPNGSEPDRTAECEKDIADLKNQKGGDEGEEEGKAEEEREDNSPEEMPVRHGDLDTTCSNVETTNLYISDDQDDAENDPALEFSQLQESCDDQSVASTDLNATSSLTGNEKAEDLSASSPEESCSDEDYIPDSAQNSDSDDCFATINVHIQKRPLSERLRTATESSSSRYVSFSYKAASSSDKSNSVRGRIAKKKKKKVPQPKTPSYTSRNYCYVCGKAQAKIARHLFTHKEEDSDIAEAFAFPKNSKERKMLLDKLRNRGNYQHNQVVLQNNSGPLKLRRKPVGSQNMQSAKMYDYCLRCKGLFSRNDLWRHMRRCHSRIDLNTGTTSTTKVPAVTTVPKLAYLEQISSRAWKMLGNMKQDEIAFVIQNDSLILQLAQSLHSKYAEDPTEFAYIKQKLREMGRLLLTLRNKSIFSCDDAINPNNFCTLLEAVKEIVGFDEEKNSYITPSRALNLVHSLKKIGDINLQGIFTVHSIQVMKESETFVRLCSKELTELLCYTALSLSKSQFKEPSTIPFIRDVQLLCQYLEMKSANAVESLKKYESPQIYAALAKVTLVQVILFNRRSARDISKLTLKSFERRDQTELHEDTPARLSQFVQSFSKHFIWTKMCQDSKEVAVLLTPEVLSALTLLVNKRDKCGVHRDNPLLFARPKRPSTSFYRGQHCVRTFANQCGAQNPKNLRSVHLHKHVTILFQILNLKSDELDELASFLSHDERSLEESGDELELDNKEDHADSVSGEHNEELDPSIQQQDELEPDDKGDDAENNVEQHIEESDASLQQQDEFEPDDEDDNVEHSDYDEHNEEPDPPLRLRGPSPSENSLSAIKSLSTVETELKNTREGDESKGEEDNSLEEIPTRHDVSEDTNVGMARSNVETDESMDTDAADIDTNEIMDTDEVEQETRMEEEKQKNLTESRKRKTILATGMNSRSSALLSRMKGLKVLIPKLNIEGLKFPVQASTMCSQTSASSTSTTRSRDQSSAAKEIGSVTENSTPTATKKQTAPTPKDPAPPLSCSHCKKNLLQGQTAYQRKGSQAIYCSTMCLSATTPLREPAAKNCYNCFKAILRPQDVILAPVDAKGTMKELCSQTCLSSFNSKWNISTTKQICCSMCSRYCVPKCEVILNGSVHKICSSACFVNFGTAKMMSMISCGNCGSNCHSKPLLLRMGNGSKILCSAECLVKFKEKIKIPQPCARCCASRAMSDMVEDKNCEDMMELFCSNLCLTTFKLQAARLSGKGSASAAAVNGTRDVEPSETKLDKETLQTPAQISQTPLCDTVKPPSSPPPLTLKEEPKDEACDQFIPSPASTKDEPDSDKEDFKISTVCSVTENSTSTATEMQTTPSLDDPAVPVVCSHCKTRLMDGQTVYQKKGSVDTYCSTTCLTASLTLIKTVTKNCHYCLKAMQPNDASLGLVCAEGTAKDFCSQTCLSSFNQKRKTLSKVPLQPVASMSFCSICTKYCTSKHKVILNGAVHKICSDACFVRFRTVNSLTLISCENCGCYFHSKPLVLKMMDGIKNLCNEDCLAKFKEKMDTPHPCAMCHASQAMSDMVENKNKENEVHLFCNNSCMMAHKIQTIAAQGALLTCDSCAKVTVPTSYLAMSDKSIRSFCTLPCAMAFQEKFKATSINVGSVTPAASTENQMASSNQSQPDELKGPVKLPCSQCYQLITAKPHLIHTKDKLVFVCSLACSLKYKTVNNVISLCEYCRTENFTRDIKRIDNKDCYFCSDNCYLRYKYDLAKSWGNHCPCCAYCFCTSKELVMGQYRGTTEEFCSDDCKFKYNKLFFNTAECDTCGLKRELQQTLPMLGEVKHFCDLNCLLHFCSRQTSTQGVNKGSVEATPVIANVISLASALARQPSASASAAQQETAPNVETKILGRASSPEAVRPPTPPVPKVLKNKAVLCRPLLVDMGIGCETQTVDTQTQTDNFFPKVVVVPLPVPVFVPVPVCMYSQVTPKPVILPIPLPVPLPVPGKLPGPEPTMEPVQENKDIPSDAPEAGLGAEKAAGRDESGQKKSQKVRGAEKERTKPEPHVPDDQASNYSDDFNIGDLSSFLGNDDDNDAHWLPSPPHGHTKPQPVLGGSETPTSDPPAMDIEADFAVENLEMMAQLREEQQHLPRSAASQRRQARRKARDKNQARRSQQTEEAAGDAMPQTENSYMVKIREPPRLKSQYGLDAWKRWTQWRQTQTGLDPISSCPVKLKEDVLHCTTAEFSDGLYHFITEVKRPNGEPYSPDSLFYLCLSIQKHLFENGREENIFTDASYGKFSTRFTQILKDFKPSVTCRSHVYYLVEEEYLWDCKQLGAYSPIVLLNTLLFLCCKYFGFTTVEQHRQLSFARIMRCTKTSTRNVETKFLRFYPPMSKKKPEAQQQPDADGVPPKKRKVEVEVSQQTTLEMTENSENPLRCPVRLYEFYLSKCSELAKRRSNLFYLHPQRSCIPSSPLWFSSTPLDDHTMEAMLTRILTVRELHVKPGEDGRKRSGEETPNDPLYLPDEEEEEDSE